MKERQARRGRRAEQAAGERTRTVTLKDVAEHLSLSPATVSLVLNRAPGASSIPPETQERVFAAARDLDYRPNYMARSLRSRRSFSVGVLVPEISEPYAAEVMSGIEGHLLQEGYHYLVASHRRSNVDLLHEYVSLLRDRAVEGLILVASQIAEQPVLPTVVVSGHVPLPGVTNVVIDHDRAARDTFSHLVGLGHERVALFKGQPGSADTEDRWRAIVEAAASRGLPIRPELTVQLSGDGQSESFSPADGYQEGYTFARQLLARQVAFTALFAFDDVSAIGAMRAFLDAGLRVPEDVSVVGFDDIQSAAYQNPTLTTVRQPLRRMGELAAQILLRRVANDESVIDGFVTVEPELIIRGSTGPVPARAWKEGERWVQAGT
ncbi:MAG TPA: LacI family DNA-binding transcriptional regulator [Thermoanaerobaculia bacterium]|jgi:LacI family transcriptional regulator|nr:LacI family DNA-binding transcriptional regulator [Thermoanaerobaculia bacterium]